MVVGVYKYNAMQKRITIGEKFISNDDPVFIIAEVGVNHNGDIEIAKQLIDVAHEAGVDAVKFQTFTAELLVTPTADQADYQQRNIGKEETQYNMLKRLELPRKWYPLLQRYCDGKGIIFISSPFSEEDADFLESINVPAYKIPSGEVTNPLYIKHIAKKGKPIIISTGMANLKEVEDAVMWIHDEGNSEVVVLHSTSNYPPSLESLNLRAIATMKRDLGSVNMLIGYSDNGSVGATADIAAVALGACVIEKHITLDKNMEGPDHRASMEPEELKNMVQALRDTQVMLGDGIKICTQEEEPIKEAARKSIVTKIDIPKGAVIGASDVCMKRPGTGMAPTELHNVVGKRAKDGIPVDVVISLDMLI